MYTEKFIEYELFVCDDFAKRNYTSIQVKKFIESRYKIDNILCMLMLSPNEKNIKKANNIKDYLINKLYEYRLKYILFSNNL